jgi:Trk K+ transport system NAD-binding subunit/Kef-type K+ transport system membrane component KefB
MPDVLTYALGFGVISLAAHRIGKWFTAVRLPYITGYLAAGAAAGSFGLGLLPEDAAESLRFIDQISLAVIAFVAGSELYLPEIRERLKSIAAHVGAITAVGYGLLVLAVFVVTGFVSFTSDMGTSERVAVAILGAAVLLALSPPSAIAVIKETLARGRFTSLVLSVTVVMDVTIIVVFAAATSLATALLHSSGIDLAFIGIILLDVSLGTALGLGIGWFFGRVVPRVPTPAAIGLILAVGYAIFLAAGAIDTWTAENFAFEVYIEPLLVAMTAGFTVTNFTPARDRFGELLHIVGPAVYVAFFTLTGLALKLDVLGTVLPAAALLFVVRVGALAGGTRLGARFSGEPPEVTRWTWLAFVTQAGIAIGLAREAGTQFPELGASFTALVISVVVLNEVFGPLMLKYALRRSGEVPGEGDEVRDAVIFGIDSQGLSIADALRSAGWGVRLVDHDPGHADRAASRGYEAEVVDAVTVDALVAVIGTSTDAVVALGEDDAINGVVCRAAAEVGVERIVARVHQLEDADALRDTGALLVDPTSAMVGLLERAVLSPLEAALILHADPARETVAVTVTDPAAAGSALRDLRLPDDVLVVAVTRDGRTVVPNGYTRLKRGDVVTLLGAPGSLVEATARLGF